MSLVNLTGGMDELDDVLAGCLRCGCFQPEMASHSTDSARGFQAVEGENPYTPVLANLLKLASDLNLEFAAAESPEKKPDLQEIREYLSSLEKKTENLTRQSRDLRESVAQHEQALIQLKHLAGLNVSFDEIFACRYVKVRFGRLPADSYAKLPYYEDKTFFFFDFDHDKDYYWGVYFAPVGGIAMIDDIFSSLYFERMRVPDYAHGTPEIASANIHSVLDYEKRDLERVARELAALRESEKQRLSQSYAALKFYQTVCDLRRYAAALNGRFYLTGFVPKREEERFQKLFEALPGVECTVKPQDADPSLSPPVKLKNNRFAAPFEQFVNMYSLPSYRDIDPTNIFAFTYTLLFGIMFGDLGQGFLLVLLGLVLAGWKKMNFGRIIIRLGASSMIFGTLYGSVFGFEELLDPVYEAMGISFLPLKVFDNDVTNLLLLGAIAIGAALICLSISINIFVGFRARDYRRAVFGNNGIAGLVLYLSAVFMVADMMLFHTGICGAAYVVCLIVLPLLLIFFSGPLSELMARRSAKPEQSAGEFFIENFFDLFDYVLSYLSNSMSFLRVGGFILSHAGMMTVVMSLADMAGNPSSFGGALGYGLVVALGNLFVMALEGLIVGIQCLRLEFYEMFSRHFEGNGKPFAPVTVPYGADR